MNRSLGFARDDGGKRLQVLICFAAAIRFDWLNQPVVSMREVQAADAKTRFPQLLDAVERGETIVIIRHGRPVAHLAPVPVSRAALAAQAIDRIKALRSRKQRVAADDILYARHEGRRC